MYHELLADNCHTVARSLEYLRSANEYTAQQYCISPVTSIASFLDVSNRASNFKLPPKLRRLDLERFLEKEKHSR